MIPNSPVVPRLLAAALALALCTTAASAPQIAAGASQTSANANVAAKTQGHAASAALFNVPLAQGQLKVSLAAPNVVHLSMQVDDHAPPRSVVTDPKFHPSAAHDAAVDNSATGITLTSPQINVRYDRATHALSIADAGNHVLLHSADLAAMARGQLSLQHDAGQPLYGVSGYIAFDKDVSAGILRNGKLEAKAGEQGWSGAPLVWSTAGWGVLANLNGGTFDLADGAVGIASPKQRPLDVYVIIGKPKAILGAVSMISGRTTLFPKWAMGFTNSQWGIDQKELLSIVDEYRAKHIPIDNFTLDFDWKAWGQDNYGELRWNPVKFPGGPTGALAKQMTARGMVMTGIMKPRIHVNTVEGKYATTHDFWVPGEKVSDDYFSHKPVKDINFDVPAARTWFGDMAVKYGFDHGIVGWWNDEADTIGSDTEFLNMQRSLYDAQRAQTNVRVWSINRNFYLGSQRYAYGLWSGDISTGFASMAGQRVRMLSAINVGEMQWGMDGGGFHGHPSDENYARWIEFGAFTPIFRVHGDFGEKRQPWTYGPVAEKAAVAAMRLRYRLIPYIYSYEWQRHTTGIGLVRPLTFDWPNDAKVKNDVASWMFGEGLLVSPVVKQGATSKQIYLPEGTWTDWFTGKVHQGGQTLKIAVDSKNWSDIPLYVRQGAIIPMQIPMDYVGEKPLTEVSVEMFPDSRRTQFEYYDDDGRTYDYEKGESFRQNLAMQRQNDQVTVQIGAPEGSFTPVTKFYLLKVHGGATNKIGGAGELKRLDNLDALQGNAGEGWANGKDRFGAVTYIKVAAGKAMQLQLHTADI